MRNWFSQLNKREQFLVIITSVVVTVWLIYILVLSPFFTHLSSLKQETQYQSALITWMKSKEHLANSKPRGSAKQKPSSLLSALNQTIEQTGLNRYAISLRQGTSKQVHLSCQQLPYAKLINLIATLERTYDINVTDAQLSITKTSGVIQANITFSPN